ncbi:hypothetical protein CH338_29050, partial [Rhodoplanes elegans]
YEVSNVGEVLKSERAFRQDVDMRLDDLERGIAALGADAGVLVARVIRAIETEIAPRAAEIEALLVGYRDGVPAAAVAESAERFFLTPARRAAIIAEAVTSGDPSAAIAAATAALAPLASPTFTGAPTAPTPPDDNASTRLATTAFVAARIAALINGAPEDLRDFDALASAINNDPNFATAVLRLDEEIVYDAPAKARGRANLGLGTAATRDVGTGADDAVALDGAGKLPAVDGSHLTHVVAEKLATADGAAPSFAARAWVNFNGVGTVAIRASGNVSSITDNGTGDYTVNFATAMPDANYCVLGIGNHDGTANQTDLHSGASAPNVSSVRIYTGTGHISGQTGGLPIDQNYVCVAVIR